MNELESFFGIELTSHQLEECQIAVDTLNEGMVENRDTVKETVGILHEALGDVSFGDTALAMIAFLAAELNDNMPGDEPDMPISGALAISRILVGLTDRTQKAIAAGEF